MANSNYTLRSVGIAKSCQNLLANELNFNSSCFSLGKHIGMTCQSLLGSKCFEDKFWSFECLAETLWSLKQKEPGLTTGFFLY